jgi:hypothetical protein
LKTKKNTRALSPNCKTQSTEGTSNLSPELPKPFN